MTDKEEVIIKNCPHVSYTAYGVYACRLYKPMDKNSFVKFGTCGANSTCPYKITGLKTQECEKYKQTLDTVSEHIKDNCNSCQGIYGGCEKCELKRIKDIINKAKDGE